SDHNEAASGSVRSSSTLFAASTTGLPPRRRTLATASSVAVAPTLASTTSSTASAVRMAWSACAATRAWNPLASGSQPPVSTTVNRRPDHCASYATRSRVTPGTSCTTASRRPRMRLTSVDLPTLGRPTTASTGRSRTSSVSSATVMAGLFPVRRAPGASRRHGPRARGGSRRRQRQRYAVSRARRTAGADHRPRPGSVTGAAPVRTASAQSTSAPWFAASSTVPPSGADPTMVIRATAQEPPRLPALPRSRPDATAASDSPIPGCHEARRPRLRRLTRRSPGSHETGPTPCRLLTLGPRKACPAPHLPCDVLFFGALAQGPSAGSRRALRARMDDVSLRRQVDKALDHLVNSHARGVDMHGVLGSPQWTVRPAAVVRVPPVEVRGRAAPLGAVLP